MGHTRRNRETGASESFLLANGFLCMEGEIGRLRFALGLVLDSHRLIKGEDEKKLGMREGVFYCQLQWS